MIRYCPVCDSPFLEGELVEVRVIAPWHEIPSTTSYSIGHPIDTYPETLRHHSCVDDMFGDDDNETN